jgi:hypothetical protein
MEKNITEIELNHLGWPDDEQWLEVFTYFENAWDFVLNRLDESCEQ